MNRSSRKYLIITPCRDEARYINRTIATVVAQSVRPATWVIVDDGSSDDTPRILAEASAKHDFILVVRRNHRGVRSVGSGVVDAFYAGYESVNPSDYEFICKMDADLELPTKYFQRLLEEMEREPRLGAVSGKMFLRDSMGHLQHERRGDDHAAGPSKFYRRVCFEDIGGFVRIVGWDGIDGHVCRMKGWIARSLMDDDLKVVHLRQMGSSHKGILHGRVRSGQGKYRIGSSPWYFLVTMAYRMADPPYVIGALAMAWGYFQAKFRGMERMDDPEYLRHLRRYEWSILLRGKRRTLRKYDEQARDRTS